MLGPDLGKQLSPSGELELVEGARSLIIDALRMNGIHDPEKANEVADRVLTVAARTLYEEGGSRTPSTLVNYVTGLVTAASNGNGAGPAHG